MDSLKVSIPVIVENGVTKTLSDKFTLMAGDTVLDNYAVAYTIGAITNPDMQPVRNGEGYFLNPITGQYEAPGAAHFTTDGLRSNIKCSVS